MRAIFLADAHLKSPEDKGYKKCVDFLDSLRKGKSDRVHLRASRLPAEDNHVDVLVIAGDFFDFWFERKGRIYPGFESVVRSILRLHEEGVRICICEGNHDFFLADFFTRRFGIEVYPEAMELVMDGMRFYVAHGDMVDRDNVKYLALRKFLRSGLIYRLQRIVPMSLLFAVARTSSGMSREMIVSAQDRMAEKMRQFAEVKFTEGFDAVILGHSHAEALSREMRDGKPRVFAAIGDWITLFTYLDCDNGNFSLKRFN